MGTHPIFESDFDCLTEKMNGILARINAVFAFAMTVCSSMTFLVFLLTVGIDMRKEYTLATKDVTLSLSKDPYGPKEKQDLGKFYFDLEADLTELMHWNNKQLFIYIMAEYSTPQNDINQVVVWDKIIKRGEKSKLSLKRKPLKYQFFDDGEGGLVNNDNVTLSMWYNTVPNAGMLPLVKAIGGSVIQFTDYSSKRL